MPATIEIIVFTGSDLSASTTHALGMQFMSRDSSASDITNRRSYPVSTCSRSYTKWIKAYISASDDSPSTITDFTLYGDGTVAAETTWYVGSTCTASPPSFHDSGISVSAFTAFETGCPFAWESGSYTAIGSIDTYGVFQLDTTSSAANSGWLERLYYTYDEGITTYTGSIWALGRISKRFRSGV